jgi:uncharacterized protein (DUF58 family)
VAGLFPSAFLKQLEGLHLLARQIARGRQRAERRSVKQGAGLEFSDYRSFAPGDDVRAIDWRVFARTRRLLLKLFEEEEDLHVHLLLDGTASMTWGNPPKFDPARQLVAGLAYLALANLDRAGVAVLGPSAEPGWSPSRGRAKFLRMLRFLEAAECTTGPCQLAGAVNRWLATRPRRGLVIWVTDAWGETRDDFFLALDRLRYARHEVGVIHLRHADEREAGELGEFACEDIETGSVRPMIIDRSVAVAYREAVSAYEERLSDYCRRHGLAHLAADAAEPAIDIIRRSLMQGGFVQ